MKKRYFFIFIISVLFILVCQPSYGAFFFEYSGPRTPFTGDFLLKRISIDSIYLEGHNAAREHQYTGKIKHSSDGLTDTLNINWTTTVIMSYDPDGKMKSYKTRNHFLYSDQDEQYTYDDQDRILEIKYSYNETHMQTKSFYYTNSGVDSILFYQKSENIFYKVYKEEIRYNSEGYDVYHYEYNNETGEYVLPLSYAAITRYIFDSGNNLVQTKSYYPSNIDADDFRSQSVYEYFNNGYKNTLVYDFGSKYSTEFYYNENGDLIEYFYRQWVNNSFWELTDYFKFEYIESSVYINEIMNPDYRIYSLENNLIIESGKESAVFIYSATGVLIKQFTLDGTSRIPLQSGFYIVSISGNSSKVYVK